MIVVENGGYTEWSDWTRCSATCGKGYRERKRYCTNPAPAYGGVNCRRLGSDKEKVDCFIADCPGEVDPGVSTETSKATNILIFIRIIPPYSRDTPLKNARF